MRLEVAEDTLNQYANVDLTSLEGLGSKKMTFFGCPVKTVGDSRDSIKTMGGKI